MSIRPLLSFALLASTLATSATAQPMRFARFQQGDKVVYGIVEKDGLREISGDLFGQWTKTDKVHNYADVIFGPDLIIGGRR